MDLRIVERYLPEWGFAYTPSGAGSFPTILVVHGEDWTGWTHRDAVMLAANGFSALPFWCPAGEQPLDRIADAMAALRAAPFSNGRVGIFALAKGGDLALMATALMARDGITPPDAVAVHSAADAVSDQGLGTWRGSSVGLQPAAPIEIQRYGGPIFISHGTEDSLRPVEGARRLEARLIAHGRMPEVHYYEGKDHGLNDEAAANRNTARWIDFFRRHLAS